MIYLMKKEAIELQYKCVYCLTTKLSSSFNRDHVIPESMGTFGTYTPTLVNLVCRDCNQYFGNSVENALGRDSVYGVIYRSMSGLIKKDLYEKIKNKANLSYATIKNDSYSNILVDISNFDKDVYPNFMVSISNQAIFMNSTKGVQIKFKLKDLPHRVKLDNMGLKIHHDFINFYFSENNLEYSIKNAQDNLLKSDIKVKIRKQYFSDIDLRGENQSLTFHSVINDSIMRAIAKIVFNYFIWQYNKIINPYSESFDDIRNYIRYGTIPRYYIIRPIFENNIVHQCKLNIFNEKNFGHTIYIEKNRYNETIAKISLLNSHIYEVVISKCYPFLLPTKASYFNITTEKICTHST